MSAGGGQLPGLPRASAAEPTPPALAPAQPQPIVFHKPQEGIDAISDVIYHIETFDVTSIRASTPMFLMSRKIKALGVKMVLSGARAGPRRRLPFDVACLWAARASGRMRLGRC